MLSCEVNLAKFVNREHPIDRNSNPPTFAGKFDIGALSMYPVPCWYHRSTHNE